MAAVGSLCTVCGVGRIKSAGALSCSVPCGLVRRHQRRDPRVFAEHIAKLRAGRRRVFLERMMERFKDEIEPFADRVPAAQLAEAFARIYRLGKVNGWQGCLARSTVLHRRSLRRSA